MADEAILLLNRDGSIRKAGATASALLGFSPAELCQMEVFDLLVLAVGDSPPPEPAFFREFRALSAAKTCSASGTARIWRKGRGSLAADWKLTVVVGESTETTLLLALRASARAPEEGVVVIGYRDIFEHAVEGLYRSSIDGHYLQVNPALARMYGYESPEKLVTQLRDIESQLYVQPNRREEFVELMNRQGFVSDFESEVLRADGSRIWIAEFGRVVLSEGGRPLYFEGSVIDTSERKRAEAALKASEEKYRRLVETTSVIPWEADLDTGAVTYIGPQIVDLLGYPIERWQDADFWQYIMHEEDRVWVEIVRGEAIAKRQQFECEYRLRRADGQYAWIREILSFIPTHDGRLALGGFMLDVTYRRESEQSLRESEDFIEQIAAASPTILYLYDPARKSCTYVNGRVPDILGYTKEVLRDMQPFFIVSLAHPDELVAHLEYFDCWTHVTSGRVLEREFRLRNAVGGWVWLRSRECIFRRESPLGPLRIIGTVEDITMQRTTIDELAENERIFRRLVETTGAVPFDFDVSDGRFAYVGPQAVRVFGHPMRRWYSTDFWESFVLPEDKNEGAHWQFFPEASRDSQVEFRVTAGNGRIMWVRQIGQWSSDEDEHRHVRGFLFDVTEAKQAEEERERSRGRLRELAARGQEIREEERVTIAREIHDELGQALTLLTIDLSWLKTRISKTVPSKTRRVLEEKIGSMEQSVQSTLQIVRRILCALRPPLLDELGLRDAIEWQMQDFSKRVGIRYELNATPITALSSGAATVVFRIFQEILTNAARHAKASRIKVLLHESESEIVMRVEDNGVGISPETLRQTKHFGILGMRERAWSVGGEVEISGELGKGTIVALLLPIKGGAVTRNSLHKCQLPNS